MFSRDFQLTKSLGATRWIQKTTQLQTCFSSPGLSLVNAQYQISPLSIKKSNMVSQYQIFEGSLTNPNNAQRAKSLKIDQRFMSNLILPKNQTTILPGISHWKLPGPSSIHQIWSPPPKMDPIPSYSFGWSARDPHLRKDQASPWHILAASNNTLGVNSPKFITRTQLAKCTSPELSKKKKHHHFSEQGRKILIRSSMKPDWFMRGSLSSLLIIPFKNWVIFHPLCTTQMNKVLVPAHLASFMNPGKNGSFRNVEHNPDGI